MCLCQHSFDNFPVITYTQKHFGIFHKVPLDVVHLPTQLPHLPRPPSCHVWGRQAPQPQAQRDGHLPEKGWGRLSVNHQSDCERKKCKCYHLSIQHLCNRMFKDTNCQNKFKKRRAVQKNYLKSFHSHGKDKVGGLRSLTVECSGDLLSAP